MATTGSSDQAQKGSSDQKQNIDKNTADAAAAADKHDGNGKMVKEMVMPQCEVDYVLSYEPVPCDPGTEAWLKALDPDLFALGVDLERRMLAEQEDFKRQIALKGYVSKMVEVANDDDDGDEDEDEDEEDYVDGGDEDEDEDEEDFVDGGSKDENEDEEDYIDGGDEDEDKDEEDYVLDHEPPEETKELN